MSGFDAIQNEMGYLGLTGNDERELRTFALATRATLVAVPDPAIGDNLIPELATAAAAGHRDNVVAAPVTTRAPRHRRRLPMVARIVFAVALLPALFAGLAVAGVKLPDVADDAFKAAGVSLPNQEDSDTTSGQGRGTEGEPGEKGQGAGQDKSNPAREQGRGNGAQGRGRALGKRGVAPGQQGKTKSNHAGGNGKGKAVGKTDSTPPGQAKIKPDPPGQAKVPPAKGKGTATPNAGGTSNAGGGGKPDTSAAGPGKGPVDSAVSVGKSVGKSLLH